MRLTKPLVALAATLGLAGPAAAEYRDTSVPMETVNINIQSYLGKWYEVARYPNRFERGCAGVTAEYGLKDNGEVSVLNTCRKGSPTGPASSREAAAEKVGPGKFKVDFVQWLPGIAKGDYWVLHVAPDYSLAVVGEPTGRYGWVLARDPQIRQSELDTALSVLRKNGYDTEELQLVAQ